MMKKVLYGVALTLFAGVSVGSLQSCKDDVNDLQTQTSYYLSDLNTAVEKLKTAVNGDIEDLKIKVGNNADDIADIKRNYATLSYVQGELANLQAAIDQQISSGLGDLQAAIDQQITSEIAKVTGALTTLSNDLEAQGNSIAALQELLKNYDQLVDQEGLKNAINAAVEGLASKSDLEGLVSKDELKDLIPEIDLSGYATKEEVEAVKTWVTSEIEGVTNALQGQIDTLKEEKADKTEVEELVQMKIEEVQEQMTMLMNYLKTEFEEAIAEVQGEVDAINTQIETINTQIETINTQIKAINTQLNSIFDALDLISAQLKKQVTGILIQSTYSPVFGDFSLPLGVRSSMLFNWYGHNDHNEDVTFPSASKTYSADDKAADLSKVQPAEYYTVPAGYFGGYGDKMTLGKVYATVNPVGVDFDDLVVNLETSAGTRLPWPVALAPSNHEIKFGYTRSKENGFYEGELIVPVEEAVCSEDSKIVVKVEESLKPAMKNILKNPSLSTAKDLVKAVYDQLSGKIPAYALRYDWNTSLDEMDPGFSGQAYSVLSQYDLAVATARPLDYAFLRDVHGSAKLPEEIGHIQNLIERIKNSGKLSFKLDNINVDKITISFDSLNIDVTNDKSDLLIVIKDVMVKDDSVKEGYKEATIVLSTKQKEDIDLSEYNNPIFSHIDGLDGIQSGIVDGIKSALDEAGSKISTEIQNQLQTQINKIIDKINSEIAGKIKDVLDSASNKLEPYFGKIDQAIDIYNKIAHKINNFLTNPNAYLQVAAFYNMGDGNYGIVSGKRNDPTVFEGDGEAYTLLLSSYTGELIVPACKKYVAITDAPAGVDLKAINTGDLNKVLDGNKIVIRLAKPSVKGVYEYTYQAIDYSGYTSTKKFYIKVK